MFVDAQDALQFAARDDVESAIHLSQQSENRQIGVGFYGVADGVRGAAKGVLKDPHALAYARGGIDVEGRAESLCQARDGDLFTTEDSAGFPAEQAMPDFTVSEPRRARFESRDGAAHVRFEALPLILIATSGWSAKAYSPSACAADGWYRGGSI